MPMSEATLDDILALLSHPDPTMRWRGATAVINNPEPSDPRVWEPLLRLVHEAEPYLAQEAMTRCCGCGRPCPTIATRWPMPCGRLAHRRHWRPLNNGTMNTETNHD